MPLNTTPSLPLNGRLKKMEGNFITITFDQMINQKTKEKYRLIFENAVEGIYQSSPDGKLLTANIALARIFGYENVEELLKNIKDVKKQIYVNPARRDKFMKLLERRGMVTDFELQAYKKDGDIIWISTNARAVKDENDQVLYYEGMVQEVTEKKLAEEERAQLIIEQTARAEAETANLKLSFLAEASRVSTSSLDYHEALKNLAHLVVPILADWCILDLIEDGKAKRVEVVHADPAKASLTKELKNKYPLSLHSRQPAAVVIRTKKPLIITKADNKWITSLAKNHRHLYLIKKLGICSYMAIPILFRGVVSGVITFSMGDSGRHYNQADLILANDLASRAAISIENSLLFTGAKQEIEERKKIEADLRVKEKQQAAIAELGQFALSRVDTKEILEKAAKVAKNILRADYIQILEISPDGNCLNLIAGQGWKKRLMHQANISKELNCQIGYTLSVKKPVIVLDLEKETRFTGSKLLLNHTVRSGMSVLISGHHKPLGVLGVHNRKLKTFSSADINFLQSLANIVSDVLQKEASLNKLRESEEQYRTLVDLAPDIIYSISVKDGTFTSLNPAFEKITGWSREKWLNKHFTELIHPEDVPESLKYLKQGLTGKSTGPFELKIKSSSGTYLIGEFRSVPRFEKGKVVSMFGIARDITKRKQIEEEYKKQKDQLEVIFQNVSDGIIVQDKSGALIFANNAAAQAVGFKDVDTLLNTSWGEFLKAFRIRDEAGKLVDTDNLPGRKALKGETPSEVVLRHFALGSKDEKWSVIKATPILDEQGKVQFVVNVFRDVTESKLSEKHKDEFLAIASHEIKTPVTSIKAFVQLLDERLKDYPDKSVINYINSVNTQLERLTRLVNELLDLSKMGRGSLPLEPTKFKVSPFLQELVDSLQPSLNSHRVMIRGKVSNRAVYWDKERISQVLVNLLTNAVKYSPDAGKILLSVKETDDKIRVGVKDYGIGIPKEYQVKIFDRFFRAVKDEGETYAGLGLGLYITAQLVRQHKGRIWVKSTPKKGSVFFVELPRIPPNAK